jgi:hypothetical protein
MAEEIQQKSVESYFIELEVPEDKKEKVLMAITDMVYSRNQRIIELEKESDIDKKKYLLDIIQEKENLIKEKINKVLAGEEEEITYDY